MKTNQWQSRIGVAILGFAMLFGTAIAFSATVQAQDPNREAQGRDRRPDDPNDRSRRGRNWDGYGNYGGSNQLRQTALNAGYNEGRKQGHKDRNRRNGGDYQNQSAYRNATKDYNSRYGDRETYQRYYREGYDTGHRDGVNGF